MREDTVLIQHMQGNPRHIKRIFNIISITALIIRSLRKRVRARGVKLMI